MVYGFDNAKNKYEVYTKNDFAVITGTVTANKPIDGHENGYGNTYVDLPNGFTIENTIIVSAMYSYYSDFFAANLTGNYIYKTNLGSMLSELHAQLGDITYTTGEERANKVIGIYFYPMSIQSTPQTVYFKLCLMKIDSEVVE